MIRNALLPAALLATAAALPHPAAAVTAGRLPVAHATAFCQPALPAFDGLIRKRPIAVQNEGDATAFITCSIPLDLGATEFDGVAVIFVNNTDAPVDVPCTFVHGLQTQLGYLPKVTAVAPGFATTAWTPEDNGGEPLVQVASLSCALPAGTGIHLMYAGMAVEVGA